MGSKARGVEIVGDRPHGTVVKAMFASRPKVNARYESKRTKFNSERCGSRYRSAASRCLNGDSPR